VSKLDDSAEVLSEFGLTPYEAKVYLSVYKLGLTTASNIAKVSGIRREEVYRTIPKLEKAGFLEKVLGRPVTVRALPIDDVLSILINRVEEEASREIRRLVAKKSELLELFQEDYLETHLPEDGTHFTLISEKDAAEKRISFLIKQAKTTIDFADTFENAFRFVLTFAEDLISANKRHVDIRIVTEYPDNTNLIPESLRKHLPEESFDIRYNDTISGHYIIIDQYQALITTSIGGTAPHGGSLWTDNPSLVGIVQKDFEKLITESSEWTDIKATSDERLMRILKRLQPRDHVVLIYESQEAKHNTLFSYIQKGLQKGEAAVYICWEETPSEILNAMIKFGIDAKEYQDSGALKILPYTEMYIKDGKFSIEEIMDVWSKSYDEAIKKGFTGMRVTGEMGCFIEHDLVEELIEYEHALHTVLEIPMMAICAYNADTLTKVENPIDVYSELVKAHGKVLFAGKGMSVRAS